MNLAVNEIQKKKKKTPLQISTYKNNFSGKNVQLDHKDYTIKPLFHYELSLHYQLTLGFELATNFRSRWMEFNSLKENHFQILGINCPGSFCTLFLKQIPWICLCNNLLVSSLVKLAPKIKRTSRGKIRKKKISLRYLKYQQFKR